MNTLDIEHLPHWPSPANPSWVSPEPLIGAVTSGTEEPERTIVAVGFVPGPENPMWGHLRVTYRR